MRTSNVSVFLNEESPDYFFFLPSLCFTHTHTHTHTHVDMYMKITKSFSPERQYSMMVKSMQLGVRLSGSEP